MSEVNSAFKLWCDEALNMFARLEAPALVYTEFKQLTPMRHDRNRENRSFLELAADDLAIRREWVMDWMKGLQRDRSPR